MHGCATLWTSSNRLVVARGWRWTAAAKGLGPPFSAMEEMVARMVPAAAVAAVASGEEGGVTVRGAVEGRNPPIPNGVRELEPPPPPPTPDRVTEGVVGNRCSVSSPVIPFTVTEGGRGSLGVGNHP